MLSVTVPVLKTATNSYRTHNYVDISGVSLSSPAEEEFFARYRRQYYEDTCFIGLTYFSINARYMWKDAFESLFPGIKFTSHKGSSTRLLADGTKCKHCSYDAVLFPCVVEFNCVLVERHPRLPLGAFITKFRGWKRTSSGNRGEPLPMLARGPLPEDLLGLQILLEDDQGAESDTTDESSTATHSISIESGSWTPDTAQNLPTNESSKHSTVYTTSDADDFSVPASPASSDVDAAGPVTDPFPYIWAGDEGALEEDNKDGIEHPFFDTHHTLKRWLDDDKNKGNGRGRGHGPSAGPSPAGVANGNTRASDNSNEATYSGYSDKKQKVTKSSTRWEREPVDEDVLEDCARLFSTACSLDDVRGAGGSDQPSDNLQPLQNRAEEQSGPLEAHDGNLENTTAQLQPVEEHINVPQRIRPLVWNPVRVTTYFEQPNAPFARCEFYVRDESLGYPMLAKMLNVGAVRLNDECVRAVASFFSDQDLVELFQSRVTFHNYQQQQELNMQQLVVSKLGHSNPSVLSLSLSSTPRLPVPAHQAFHVEAGNAWMQSTAGFWSKLSKLVLKEVRGLSAQVLREMTDGLPLLEDLTITDPVSSGGVVRVLSVHSPRLRSLTMHGCMPDLAGSSFFPLLQDLFVIIGNLGSKFVSALPVHCPQLRCLKLRIFKANISDASVEDLCCGCKQLTKLVISGPAVSLGPQSINAVACHLPCVQVVGLALKYSTAKEVHGWIPEFHALMTNCQQLQELHLHWSTVLVLTFHHEDLLGRLQKLTVYGEVPRITADLAEALNCTQQEDLTEVIPARFASLLHNLKYFRVRLDSINSNSMVHHMALHMTQLESLQLSGCTDLTDAPLQMLFANNKRLQSVMVVDGESLTDDVVVPLCAPGNVVREVSFRWSPELTDTAVVALAMNCPNLEVLDVSYSFHLTDSALHALANHAQLLRELHVQKASNFTPHAIIHLVERCRRLQVLRVNDSCLTEEQAQGLMEINTYRQLLVERRKNYGSP